MIEIVTLNNIFIVNNKLNNGKRKLFFRREVGDGGK